MRYSVVLPRPEAGDADETKEALKSASELWARGDQREALRAVRRAAWGCSKAGNDSRALALSKAAKALQEQLEAAAHDGGDSPELQPRTHRDTPPSRHEVGVMVRGTGSDSPPRSKRPRTSRRPPGRSSSPNQRAPSKQPAAPDVHSSSRAAASPASGPRSGPQTSSKLAPSSLSLADSGVELDLVVTVAPGDWKDTEAATLVGHRAARVAVVPVAGKKGTFVVRVLGAGEVAPANSAIAVLVALETGGQQVSKAG